MTQNLEERTYLFESEKISYKKFQEKLIEIFLYAKNNTDFNIYEFFYDIRQANHLSSEEMSIIIRELNSGIDRKIKETITSAENAYLQTKFNRRGE